MNHEVKQLQDTFTLISENYKPGLCVVVVKKRIHTRLLQRTPKGSENPQPGTVVDAKCVNKNWYDFFLISQSVRQGKATFFVVWIQ